MNLDIVIHPSGWTETEKLAEERPCRNFNLAENTIRSLLTNREFTYSELLKLVKGYRKNNSELVASIAIKQAITRDKKLLSEEQEKAEPNVELVEKLEIAIADAENTFLSMRPPGVLATPAKAIAAVKAGESVRGIPDCKCLTHKEVLEIIEKVHADLQKTYTYLSNDEV